MNAGEGQPLWGDEALVPRHLAETSALWPTFAGLGLLLLMLVAAFLIGYCLQVGRRRPVERMTLEEDACSDIGNEKQVDPLALSSTRPSSSCSAQGMWSQPRPATGEFRPRSAQELPRSRQVRTVLEAEMLENEDFDWARPISDASQGRFTVEDLCTVYLGEKRPATSPALPTAELPGLLEVEMSTASIRDADEREFMHMQVPPLKRSRHREDVPYKEVWANTQNNLLFEVWRGRELVKEWHVPKKRRPPRLSRAWTVGSNVFEPQGDVWQASEPRPDLSASSWFSGGQFVRPPTLKSRAPEPSPPSPTTFQRATTAAAWMFGRARAPVQTTDVEQGELLVHEMLEQLQHTRAEPLQVRKLIFKDLQRQLHPDKNTHCEEAAKQAFVKLMEERKSYLKP